VQEIFSFVAWMKLENIVPNEINQEQKDKCCLISLLCGILKA
jgi:hypothetical protein